MFWICLLKIIPIVQACGVAVHLELVDRILPLLPDRIARHYNYVRSGAFYPDAFYNCMGQYDVAEDAHWPPFLANGIVLVRDRQKNGINTDKLEAFLIGILSHQVSDVSWHSLGIFEGLLRAMAETEFDGDYNKAHSVLDIGGDMIELSRRADRTVKSTKWEYDVNDILALLEANGYTDIPSRSIKFCMARGHAAYSAELRVAGIGFKRYARQSPMLFDKLESYFAGGMTDMHEQIEECMPKLFQWFSQGVSGNPWDLCQVFQGAQLDHSRPFADAVTELEVAESETSLDTTVHYHRCKRETYFNSINAAKALDLLSDIVNTGRDKALPACVKPHVASNLISVPSSPANLINQTVASTVQPSFGQSMIFWEDFLVVGAPSEGRVYIYNSTDSLDLPHVTLKSPNELKVSGKFATRFGAALATWGNRVVISSPGLNQLDLYDIHGKWCGGVQLDSTTYGYGNRGLKLFGETLAADETANVLYVGAPFVDIIDESVHIANTTEDGIDRSQDQVGMVFALRGSVFEEIMNEGTSGGYVVLNAENYILYQGKTHYEQAGLSLEVTPQFVLVGTPGTSQVIGFDRITGKQLLILSGSSFNTKKPSGFGGYLLAGNVDHIVIGSPAGSIPDVEGETSADQHGVVSLFEHRRAVNVEGLNEFDWFGSNGVIVGHNLYVASPHAAEGHGALWVVNMKKPQVKEIGSVKDSFASGFGASIATNGKLLAVGMPYYGLATRQSRKGAVAIIHLHKK